jgi:hypothetical protein
MSRESKNSDSASLLAYSRTESQSESESQEHVYWETGRRSESGRRRTRSPSPSLESAPSLDDVQSYRGSPTPSIEPEEMNVEETSTASVVRRSSTIEIQSTPHGFVYLNDDELEALNDDELAEYSRRQQQYERDPASLLVDDPASLLVRRPSDASIIVDDPNDPSLLVRRPSGASIIVDDPNDPSLLVRRPSGASIIVEDPSEASILASRSLISMADPKLSPEVYEERYDTPKIVWYEDYKAQHAHPSALQYQLLSEYDIEKDITRAAERSIMDAL